MRLFLPILLVAASTAVAQKPVSDPGFARLPGPALRTADSIRIDVKQAKLENPLTLFPGPRGGLIVYSQWGTVTAFDSAGRRLWGNAQVDRQQRREREIAEITAFGWRGNEQWASDAAFGQIALLDQFGNVTKSIELPSWVRPSFSNRKTFPVFESMRVFGLYEDGSMLVMPRGTVKVTGATAYDEKMAYLLKINEDGVIQRTVAKFPSASVIAKTPEGEEFRFLNPLYQSMYRVSPDGMRVIVTSVDTTTPKLDNVTIRALNDRGDTVYTHKFAYPAMTYTEAQIDSIGRQQWGNDTEYRERRTKLLPRRAPAVISLALDADKSVWITFRGNGKSRSVLGIDAAGKVLGKFELPARRMVKAANLGRLWIGEANSAVRGDLVRYRLVK
ncbi:MAG: hypothetical protein ABIR92_08535 [Gemmatimonadaceae bacterium]